MAIKKFDRPLLLDCAAEFLTWMGLQDPAYAERIQITKDEYKLDDLQVAAMYVARVLDLGEHMCYCEREFMNPGYAGHLGPRECAYCGVPFTPARADDLICTAQACLDKKVVQLDAEFEGRAAEVKQNAAK